MADGPGGKSAGRVSIRVVPDATRFRADLKKSLDRIEKSTVLNIPLAVQTRQAEVDLRKFVKKWNGEAINLDVDASTLGATTHLKEFTRRRTAPIDVQITKKSIAKAATVIASLSGARVAGDLVKKISTSLQGLDRSLPKIAAIVLAIGSIGSLALSSVGGIFTLAASLSALAGLAAPMAGVLGAAATGAIVLGVALSSAKTELASLNPVWSNLKAIITDNFWAKAKKPIIDFVRSTLPQLQAGLAPVASALGSWAASVAAGFQKAFSGGVLEGMLTKLRQSIDIASSGTGDFANSIATLGSFGANYLPRLAQWFAGLANSFDGWLSKVANDGRLAGWVENGLIVVHQLGDAFAAVVSIISGVSAAASAAGGGGLLTLASALSKIATVVNSPAFQSALTTLFAGASAGVSGLLAALTPIGRLLTSLAPTISSVLSSIGVTLGTVIGRIADTLASPEISAGIFALFNGIRDALQGLLPALPSLGKLLGSVATLAGTLAGQLGQALGQSILTVTPLLTTLLDAIEPLIPQLGQALITALIQLTPSLLDLVKAILPLLPQLSTLVTGLLPSLTQSLVVSTPLLVMLIGAVNGILNPFRMWIDLGGNLISTMSGAQSVTETMTKVLRGDFGPVFQWLAQVIPPVANAIRNGLGGAADFVSAAFRNVGGIVRGAINSVISAVNGAIAALNRLHITIPAWVPGLGGQTFGINLPTIPHLASGADIAASHGGTLFVGGEGGKKETVTDFGKTNRLIDGANQLARRAISASGGQPGVINNYITEAEDPRVTARAMAREYSAAMAGSI